MRKVAAFIIIIVVSYAADSTGLRTASGTCTDKKAANTVLPPSHTEHYDYHEVCGCCEKDMQCEMMDKALRWKDGNKYDSLTRWKMKWEYDHVRESSACSADSFRITVDVTYHLPKWVCAGHAPQGLIDKWDRYIRNLNLHEKGHGDKALRAAEELTRSIAEMGPASSCAELDRNIESLCQQRMKQLDREQEAYDAATGNGRTQGAVFP